MAWAIGTGKWPQCLTQWPFIECIDQFPIMTWPIHSIKAPYCTDHVFYLLNARFFGFWRSVVKSLSDWLLFLFLVSFVLEVFIQQWCSETSTKFLMRSLFPLVSLFWVSVSTRSLVSWFLMPKVHFWSLIFVFSFPNCVSQGGVLGELVLRKQNEYKMAHNGNGTNPLCS